MAKAVAGENIITISDSEDEDGDETAGKSDILEDTAGVTR